MSVLLSVSSRTAACSALAALPDIGTLNPNGYINIYTSPRPSAPEIPSTPATKLVTIPLANPAFPTPLNGEATANGMGITAFTAEATGTATWYRVFDRDNNALWDGNISLSGDGGDMQFQDINFILGGKVVIQTFKIVMPQ